MGFLPIPSPFLGNAATRSNSPARWDVSWRFRRKALDEVNKEYVDTARSLGLSENKVIYKYTLRNALIPTITISGLQFGNLMGGTVILEQIFAWPGIGQTIFQAIQLMLKMRSPREFRSAQTATA